MRFRYVEPLAPPVEDDDASTIDFDSDEGHWHVRPLEMADQAWVLEPDFPRFSDLATFEDWCEDVTGAGLDVVFGPDQDVDENEVT